MGLKSLKSYGLKFKELKEVSVALNEVDIATAIPTKVGTKGEEMLSAFMDAIEEVDDTADIPEDVSKYYDALPQEAFDDDTDAVADATSSKVEAPEEEAPEEEAPEEVTVESDCPSFLEGCDDKEPDCKECAAELPAEYEACKKATKAKAKSKSKKKAKAKSGSKTAGKRSRYGHMPTSMAGYIDDMVYEGATKLDMVAALMKQFKRTKEKAQSKINSHLNTLANKKGITIKEKNDGVFKAKEKYAEGYNKNNTVVASK